MLWDKKHTLSIPILSRGKRIRSQDQRRHDNEDVGCRTSSCVYCVDGQLTGGGGSVWDSTHRQVSHAATALFRGYAAAWARLPLRLFPATAWEAGNDALCGIV